MSKERLIEIIIKEKFDENPDAKLYEPVSTDILFLLTNYDCRFCMNRFGFFLDETPVILVYLVKCITLNEDGSPTKIKEWSEKDCNTILEIISKNI